MPLMEVIFHAMVDKYRYELELMEEALLNTSSLGATMSYAPKEAVEKKKRNIKRVQKLGVFGFPVLFALFALMYFIIGSSL